MITSRLTRVAAQLNDIDKAKANELLDKLPIITKNLPNVRDLINNNQFNTSGNIAQDIKTLQNLALAILQPRFKNSSAINKDRIEAKISQDFNDVMNQLANGIDIKNLADQYINVTKSSNTPTNVRPSSIQQKTYTQKEKDQINSQPRIKSRRTNNGDVMTDASEKVYRRILNMLAGRPTEKTKEEGLDNIAAYMKYLNTKFPEFANSVKSEIASGKLHITWGGLEGEVISLLKLMRKLEKDNTLNDSAIHDSLQDLFSAYKNGTPMQDLTYIVRKTSTTIKNSIEDMGENALTREDRINNSTSLLRGDKASEDLLNFNCIIGSDNIRNELYQCKQFIETMHNKVYDKLANLLIENERDHILSNEDKDLYTQIINNIDIVSKNYDKVLAKMQDAYKGFDEKSLGKQKKYFNYIVGLWLSMDGGRSITSLVNKTYRMMPKELKSSVFNNKVDYSDMPKQFSKEIWKAMDDDQRKTIVLFDKRGVLSDYGQIAPLALLCRQYFKNNVCDTKIAAFDTEFQELMASKDYAGALEFQKNFLLELADQLETDIKRIQTQLGQKFGKFENLIRNIDIDDSDPFTWLQNFRNILNSGIIGTTNNGKPTICTAENFYAVVFNATLKSLNLGVYKRIDKTAENYLKKAKEALRSGGDDSVGDFKFKDPKKPTDSESPIVSPNQSVWTNKRRQTITPIVERNNLASSMRRLLKKIS